MQYRSKQSPGWWIKTWKWASCGTFAHLMRIWPKEREQKVIFLLVSAFVSISVNTATGLRVTQIKKPLGGVFYVFSFDGRSAGSLVWWQHWLFASTLTLLNRDVPTGLCGSPGPHCGRRHAPCSYPHITLAQWSREVTGTAPADQSQLAEEGRSSSRGQGEATRGLFFPQSHGPKGFFLSVCCPKHKKQDRGLVGSTGWTMKRRE